MASFFSFMATGEDLTARWVFFQAHFLAMHHVFELMPFLHLAPLVAPKMTLWCPLGKIKAKIVGMYRYFYYFC